MDTTRRQTLTPVPRRGRPRLTPEPCTSVSTWIEEPYHDKLVRLANHHNLSVSGLVKRLIILQLDKR
jgi:hypothetical protein